MSHPIQTLILHQGPDQQRTQLNGYLLFTPQSKAKQKTPVIADWGFLGCKSLTMTYFHTGTRTIIGAEAFHCPVRDGKEWDQLAMVIRHKGLLT